MLHIIHEEAHDAFGGWKFSCTSERAIQGGGRTRQASIDASEHSARFHLSNMAGHAVGASAANRLTLHTCVGSST